MKFTVIVEDNSAGVDEKFYFFDKSDFSALPKTLTAVQFDDELGVGELEFSDRPNRVIDTKTFDASIKPWFQKWNQKRLAEIEERRLEKEAYEASFPIVDALEATFPVVPRGDIKEALGNEFYKFYTLKLRRRRTDNEIIGVQVSYESGNETKVGFKSLTFLDDILMRAKKFKIPIFFTFNPTAISQDNFVRILKPYGFKFSRNEIDDIAYIVEYDPVKRKEDQQALKDKGIK
jgi:hypothetical protein